MISLRDKDYLTLSIFTFDKPIQDGLFILIKSSEMITNNGMQTLGAVWCQKASIKIKLTFLRIITGFSDTVSRLDVILLCARRRMGDGALGSGAGSSRSGGLVPTSVMSISDLARNRSLAVKLFLGNWRVEWELRRDPAGIMIPSLQRWFDIPTTARRWTALNKQLQFVDKPSACRSTSSCYRKPKRRCTSVTLATNRVVRCLVSWQKPSVGYGPCKRRSSGAVCRERLPL